MDSAGRLECRGMNTPNELYLIINFSYYDSLITLGHTVGVAGYRENYPCAGGGYRVEIPNSMQLVRMRD